MKAVRFKQTGGAEVLQYEEVPDPAPGQREALVEIEAAGLNYIDTYHREGLYPVDLPCIPGMEGAGVIEAVGSPHAWRQAVSVVRTGGTVNFFGGCPKRTLVCFDTGKIHYSSLTLRSTFHHTPHHIREALGLIAREDVYPADFIEHQAPLSDLLAVFRRMATESGRLKTAIVPRD